MTESRSTEPVSWLRLERYHLGELSAEEAAEVAAAIASDPATRECFEIIQRPVSLNPLPELPSGSLVQAPAPERLAAPAALNPTPELPSGVLRFLRVVRSPAPMALLAVAAAALVYVAVQPTEHVDGAPAPRFRTKGGDVAMELVRERAGVIQPRPTTFGDGDRFKVVLTCPPAMTESFEVLVFQGADVSRPLSPLAPVVCSNGVALPGAFALNGAEPSIICVAWGKSASDGTAERGGPAALQGTAVCTTVVPEH